MADPMDPSPAPAAAADAAPKAGGRPEALWPLAALAAVALLVVGGLALGLVLILGRNGGASGSSVQVNPVINMGGSGAGAAAAGPPATVPTSGPRRGEAPAGGSQRDAAQDERAVALPGVLATPTPQGGKRERQIVRSELDSPPSPAFPAANPRVYMRVRTVNGGDWDGRQALPMPIRASIDATGKVGKVFAEHQAGTAAVPAAPDVHYADTGASQAGWDLQLSGVRKTGALDGYRAPAGFLFLTAHLKAQNKEAVPLRLDGDRFEVRDSDGVRYLCIPELDQGMPAAAVAAGAGADLTLSFLVLDSADLRSVALLADGAPVLLPLTRN